MSGLSVSGDSTDGLQATVATDVGTLTVPTHTNLTLAYNNHWSGDQAVTFSGLQSDIDAALAGLELVTGNNAGSTAHLSLTAMVAESSYNYLAGNQHFYEYVASPGISWQAADTAAKAMSFNGQPGYLATIPNSTVNTFITSKIQGANNVWFGARSYESIATDGTQSEAVVGGTTYGRVWRWTVGADESPIAGQVVSICTQTSTAQSTPCDFVSGSGYNSWSSGEPNNWGGSSTVAYAGEWAAVTNWSTGPGLWNDLAPNASGIGGYVVEFGGKTNTDSGGSGFTGVVTATSSVPVNDVPAAPSLTATRGDSAAALSWNTPSDNGSAITKYQVSTDGGTTWTDVTTSGSAPVTATLSGLTNGTTYPVKVRAVNAVGNGAPSTAADVTPLTVPGPPTSLSATASDRSIALSFTPPGDDGGSPITGYQVSTDGGATWSSLSTSGSGSLTGAVNGLTNGVSYSFEVRAVNGPGAGPAAGPLTGTPARPPSAPTAISVTNVGAVVTVRWSPPTDNGGAAISGYTVTAEPGGTTCTTGATSCTFAGLPKGVSYHFTVAATNAVGGSTGSSGAGGTGTGTSVSSDPVLLQTVPSAPRGLRVGSGDRTLTLTFQQPADDGGSAITGYRVSLDGGRTWQVVRAHGGSPLSAVVRGVRNGSSFHVTVRAVNAVGSGAATGTTARRTTPWFTDPVSRTARRAELATPNAPVAYRGPLRQTTATARSFHGTPARTVAQIHGRQLQPGQAASLGTDGLFAFNSATLTPQGQAALSALVRSLRYDHAVTCEGYTDYGGRSPHQHALSVQRARAVCLALRADGARVRVRVVGYGALHPVIVGGYQADRAANRRVVILVTR